MYDLAQRILSSGDSVILEHTKKSAPIFRVASAHLVKLVIGEGKVLEVLTYEG